MLIFPVLDQKTLFGKIWSEKSQLPVQAEIWDHKTNLNMQNSMMMLTFSVFDRKRLFVQI